MRWDDERYVRLYTRDTPAWVAMPWQARAIFYELLRKVDRGGFVPVGKSGVPAIATLLILPVEVVNAYLPVLLDDGCVIQVQGGLLIRNYIEAQETRQTDAARKRVQRQRERDALRKPRAGDESHEMSHGNVTVDVTSLHAMPSLAMPSLAKPETNADFAAVGPEAPASFQSSDLPLRHSAPTAPVSPSAPTTPDPLQPALGQSLARQPSHLHGPIDSAGAAQSPDSAPPQRIAPAVQPLQLAHPSPAEPDPVRQIYDAYIIAWKRVVGGNRQPQLDDKRRRAIKARLAHGFTVEDLVAACQGVFKSDWHVTNGRVSLDLIMRDAGHVEQFIGYYEQAQRRGQSNQPAAHRPRGTKMVQME